MIFVNEKTDIPKLPFLILVPGFSLLFIVQLSLYRSKAALQFCILFFEQVNFLLLLLHGFHQWHDKIGIA